MVYPLGHRGSWELSSRIDCQYPESSCGLSPCLLSEFKTRQSLNSPSSSFLNCHGRLSFCFALCKNYCRLPMRPVVTSVFEVLSLTASYVIQDVSPQYCYVTCTGIKGLGSCQLTVSPAPLHTQVCMPLSLLLCPLRCSACYSALPFFCVQ